MGAYGSPELGHFGNNNKKAVKFNNNNNHWNGWLRLISAIVFIAVLLTSKENFSFVRDFTKIINLNKTTNGSTQPFQSSILNTLDHNTGTYLSKERDLKSEIDNFFMIETSNLIIGSYNAIESQKKITEISKEIDTLKNSAIGINFIEYKQDTEDNFSATINLLQNYLNNGNYTYDQIANLWTNFREFENKHFQNMIKIFDKNNIEYTLTKNDDGSQNIQYYYKGR